MTSPVRGEDVSAARDAVVLVAVALLATLAYSLLYPWRGYTVPAGLDTPVYLWSARHAATFGLDAAGLLGRPGAFGAVAVLLQSPAADRTVIAALPIAVITAAALAAAAFAAAAFAAWRSLVLVVTGIVALFLTPLADGFLASAMFLAGLTAGLAVLVAGPPSWRAILLAAALFAAGAISHPVFATIGVPVIAIAIAAAVLRRGSIAGWRTVSIGATGALAAAAVLTLAIVLALAPDGPALDTSYDGALRRLGAVRQTVIFRRHSLLDELPAFLFLVVAAALSVDRLATRADPTGDLTRRTLFWGACAGWFVMTAAAVAALAAGVPVPAHRLLWVCLPPAVLIGVSAVRPLGSERRAGRSGVLVRTAVPVAVLVVFASAHALRLRSVEPTVEPAEARFLSDLGAALDAARSVEGALLLSGDHVLVQDMIDEWNWMRASVSPDRLHDVLVFPGGPSTLFGPGPAPTGDAAFDLVVADRASSARSSIDRGWVVVASASIDRAAADEARARDAHVPFAADAVLLAPRQDAEASPLPAVGGGGGPMSPWSVVAWAPLLVAVFGVAGFGWARWAIPRRSMLELLCLSPACGLAAITLASVLTDLAGLRLVSSGWAVALALASLPGIVLGLRGTGPRTTDDPMTEQDDPEGRR